MNIEVLPANIKTVKVRVRKRGPYTHATITFPPDIVKRYGVKDGDEVVICYLCRSEENDCFK